MSDCTTNAELLPCDRCGTTLGSDSRRILLVDRRAAAGTQYRGRRLERTLCAVCAEALRELLMDATAAAWRPRQASA